FDVELRLPVGRVEIHAESRRAGMTRARQPGPDPRVQLDTDFAVKQHSLLAHYALHNLLGQSRVPGQPFDAISLGPADESAVYVHIRPQVEVRSLIVAVPQAQPDFKGAETCDKARTAAAEAVDFPLVDELPRISTRFAQSRRVHIGREAGARGRGGENEV